MKKWFENVDCIEELKSQYRKLAMKFHPDRGGSNEDMKSINAEYEMLFGKYKDIHRSTREDGPRVYEAQEKTSETAEEFINICFELFRLDGIIVEQAGRWLWISGETMKHKDKLKSLGCRWSSKKRMWSFHHEDAGALQYKGKKEWSMERIRSTFGSEILEPDKKRDKKLAIPA